MSNLSPLAIAFRLRKTVATPEAISLGTHIEWLAQEITLNPRVPNLHRQLEGELKRAKAFLA